MQPNLSEFEEFLRINMRLAPVTVQKAVENIKRFLEYTKGEISYESIKNYLATYIDKRPKTYNSQITDLRRFIRDFLGYGELIKPFRMAPVDDANKPVKLPTKKQLRLGFEAQTDDRARAIYLFTATTGLRKCEILTVLKEHVNFKLRCVIPNHFTRKKRSGITFYNEETERFLMKYLESRKDNDPRLFVISDRQFRKIWRQATRRAGVKITPQILRVWFATYMGEKLIPDRYVDIFQGRAPRSVLAKHYTGKGLKRLKRIYEKAKLKILT